MNLKTLFLLTLIVISSACSVKEKPTDKPNVIILLADDLGSGDVQCYNAESKIPTPDGFSSIKGSGLKRSASWGDSRRSLYRATDSVES